MAHGVTNLGVVFVRATRDTLSSRIFRVATPYSLLLLAPTNAGCNGRLRQLAGDHKSSCADSCCKLLTALAVNGAALLSLLAFSLFGLT